MAKKIIFSEKAPVPIGPYSQAVMVDNVLYVSGQVAIELSTSGDLRAEATQVMENIGHILTAAGLTYANIVKSSIFLKNMDDFGLVNEVYGAYFENEPPARETVQVAKLPKDVNVEISVIAVQD
jgi:2-iminobutanoate/2-iminopropanoate deaminase